MMFGGGDVDGTPHRAPLPLRPERPPPFFEHVLFVSSMSLSRSAFTTTLPDRGAYKHCVQIQRGACERRGGRRRARDTFLAVCNSVRSALLTSSEHSSSLLRAFTSIDDTNSYGRE